MAAFALASAARPLTTKLPLPSWPEPTTSAPVQQLVLRLRANAPGPSLWLSLGTCLGLAGPQAFAAAALFDRTQPMGRQVEPFVEHWPLSRAALGPADDGEPGPATALGLGVGECHMGPQRSHGLLVRPDAALAWDLRYTAAPAPHGGADGALLADGYVEVWRPYAANAHCVRLQVTAVTWQASQVLWRTPCRPDYRFTADAVAGTSDSATTDTARRLVLRSGTDLPWSPQQNTGAVPRKQRAHLSVEKRHYNLRVSSLIEERQPHAEAHTTSTSLDALNEPQSTATATKALLLRLHAGTTTGRLSLRLSAPRHLTARFRDLGPGVLHVSELAGATGSWRPYFGAQHTFALPAPAEVSLAWRQNE